jgi:hypothetical protein
MRCAQADGEAAVRTAAAVASGIQAGLIFRCAGNALSHTEQARWPSRTMLSRPQAGQRRNTILCVKSPGCATPTRSSAAATACQESVSGQ